MALDQLKSVVALAGGVGGAKLADGLARCLPPGVLTVIVNTGDDFRHYGLAISPDLDTVMYTLGGVANNVNGWGLEGDTQQMLGMMRRYADAAWFGLGDKDLATHLLRTQWLAEGITLTEVTQRLSAALGIHSRILPMSDEAMPTLINTVEYGQLPFQEYFVRYHWQPTLKPGQIDGQDLLPIQFDGEAYASPQVLDALRGADLIIVCPSNPLLSIMPILETVGFQEVLAVRKAPCIAVSPLIDGKAVKGPAAKLMAELNMPVSAQGVLEFYHKYYDNVLDGIVIDSADQVDAERVLSTDILMQSLEDRTRLAKELLEWVTRWRN